MCDHYEKYRVVVKENFNHYRRNRLKSTIAFGLESTLEAFKNDLDTASLFKPIIQECIAIIEHEEFNPENLSIHLEHLRDEIKESCSQRDITFEEENQFLNYLYTWFDFHIARLRRFRRGLQDDHHLFLWLRCCYDLTDGDVGHFFNVFELNRDIEIRRVVFTETGHVRDFFRLSNRPGHVYLNRLCVWFFARYDLDAAAALLNLSGGLRQQPTKIHAIGTGTLTRTCLKSWSFWVALLSTFFLILGTYGWLIFHHVWYDLLERLWPVPFGYFSPELSFPKLLTSSKIQLWRMIPYQLGLSLVGVMLLVWIIKRLKTNTFAVILPRLFAGLVLGYIPFISSEDVWIFLLGASTPQSLCIVAIMLVSTCVYLFVEGMSTLQPNRAHQCIMKREMFIRAVHVLTFGLVESYVLGMFLCELLAPPILLNIMDKVPLTYVIHGWIGFLVPKMVFLYAPIALFLGIFLQLIWEEKTVPHPL